MTTLPAKGTSRIVEIAICGVAVNGVPMMFISDLCRRYLKPFGAVPHTNPNPRGSSPSRTDGTGDIPPPVSGAGNS
jgi:hypothetical protein